MDGTEKTVQAEIGKNLMEIAHEHNVDLEGKVTSATKRSSLFEKSFFSKRFLLQTNPLLMHTLYCFFIISSSSS